MEEVNELYAIQPAQFLLTVVDDDDELVMRLVLEPELADLWRYAIQQTEVEISIVQLEELNCWDDECVCIDLHQIEHLLSYHKYQLGAEPTSSAKRSAHVK